MFPGLGTKKYVVDSNLNFQYVISENYSAMFVESLISTINIPGVSVRDESKAKFISFLAYTLYITSSFYTPCLLVVPL
jgi:hypothetical protein